MSFSRAALFGLFVQLIICSQHAVAVVQTIAITADDAGGVIGGKFASLELGPINANGQVVFTAQLQQGLGGVGVADDQGVWLFDGASNLLVAREGIANVPGVAAGEFQVFHDIAIDTAGNATLRAALEVGPGGVASDSNQGIWKYPSGVGSLIARTGSGNVPGVAGASFAGLPFALSMNNQGNLALSGSLVIGGGISPLDDRGVWTYDSLGGTLVAREGITSTPDVGGGTFSTFGEPRTNSAGDTVFMGVMNVVGGITNSNRTGIWRFTPLGGSLVARTGVGNVPDLPGENFSLFEPPSINASGQIALSGTLAASVGVNSSNDRGVWLYTGTTGTMLAREGSAAVPEIAGANFADFQSSLLNDAGNVAVIGSLEIGPGGVAAGDNQGIWFLEGGGQLAARTGSGNVPGVASANFASFDKIALNTEGSLAIAATLESGVGGVAANNDTGLWLIDSMGSGTLVAREGDLLAGRTIDTLDFVGNSAGTDGRATGLNDIGQLAFQATFTNGDSGLFLFSSFAADFDNDGDVDDADLAIWNTSYATNSGADADSDGDSDGNDFLIWQQQFGNGVSPLAVSKSVPEPLSEGLLILGIAWTIVGRQRGLQWSAGHRKFDKESRCSSA